ncbi:MAG: hypothetical protein Q8918_05550 [Bacteroidota bacterium]|nr:hypothetical protein [Bacteroidota bacterium]
MANSLGIDFHIVGYSLRQGYAAGHPSNYLSVRRDVEDFAYHNKYG